MAGGMAGTAGRMANACRAPSNRRRIVQGECGSTWGVAVLTHSDFGAPRRQPSGLPPPVRGRFDPLLGAVGVTGRDFCSLSTAFAPSSRNCTQKAGLVRVIHVREHDQRGRGHARWLMGPN